VDDARARKERLLFVQKYSVLRRYIFYLMPRIPRRKSGITVLKENPPFLSAAHPILVFRRRVPKFRLPERLHGLDNILYTWSSDKDRSPHKRIS